MINRQSGRSGRQILENWLLTLFSLAIALIPVWLYFAARHFLNPNGFWQNLVLLGAGVWFFGFAQLIFLVIWIIYLSVVWDW